MERCVARLSPNDKNVKVRSESHIPNDIFFSILSKLPIKPLKRFGCVSKSWSLLFDDEYFMTMYRNNLLTKDHSYCRDTSVLLHQTFNCRNGEYREEIFDLYYVGERFENRVKLDWPSVDLESVVYGFDDVGSVSVHGILCLLRKSPEIEEYIILWNPSTKEFKVVPLSPLHSGTYLDVWVGYDRFRNDYKLLCNRRKCFTVDVPCMWEVYSLRSNSWRKIDVDIHHEFMYDQQLYLDGLSHSVCRNETYLLSFDWSKEVFLSTPIPSDIDGSFDDFWAWRELMQLNGSIAFISNYLETDTFHISILGQLGVKESWTKIFIVGLLPCLEYPIGAGKKGNMLFDTKDRGLAWFNLNTQMIEDIDVKKNRFSWKIIIHKESLLPFEGANI